MHEVSSIWALSLVIFVTVVISKIISKKTSTVDVLWLIVFWAILSNLGVIPSSHELLEFIWELGIIFVMFALGFEEDLSNFIRGLKRSWWVAIFWAIFPFAAWYFSAIYLWYGPNSALIWGLTMTATAVSLTMMSLKSRWLSKTVAATWIMTAAVIDDILSLVWVAVIIPLAILSSWSADISSHSLFASIAIILSKVWLFFLIAIALRILIFYDKESKFLIVNYPFLKKIFKSINNFFKIIWLKKIFSMYEWEFTPLVLLTVAMWMWVIAECLWFHPAIWAYILWLILQKHHFHHFDDVVDDGKIYEQSKIVVDHVAFTIFWPIFFVTLWAKILLEKELLLEILPWVILLFVLVFVLQILSASISARFLWKYKWCESLMIWFWMLWRAELAFIVINIAFVKEKIISLEQFYILIFTAFLLNLCVPIIIGLWEPYFKWTKKLEIFWVRLSKDIE